MSIISIRPAIIKDAPCILTFVKELAAYEKAPQEVIATVENYEATLFAKN